MKKELTTADTMKFTLIFLIITCFLLGAGAGIGYYWAINKFRSSIISNSHAETLGNLLDKTRKIAISQSYYNPAQVENDINNYSWAVPTVISPFVGHAPEPGKHGNAEVNSKQFRSAKELIIPKPAQNYRIFISSIL